MNNFSDLLATEQRISLSIRLIPIVDNGDPVVTAAVNDRVLYSGRLSNPVTISNNFGLLEPLRISIELADKIYHETLETAVMIESILIDGKELAPRFCHLAEYINDQQKSSPTTYLGYNGIWSLVIDRPFYQWWHQVTGQGWLLEPRV